MESLAQQRGARHGCHRVDLIKDFEFGSNISIIMNSGYIVVVINGGHEMVYRMFIIKPSAIIISHCG